MPIQETEREVVSTATEDVLVAPVAQPHRTDLSSSHSSKYPDAEKPTEFEFIDSRELARRLTLPPSWVRDQVRARSEDPLPHVNFGKYVRFLWGSPALELWIKRRIVVGNNRRLGRTRRKEQE